VPVLFHFSEDPGITRFVPHVPVTNPAQPPSVWAIDADHEALYWFPRDCPRVAVWPYPGQDVDAFRDAFRTSASRLHVIERAWWDRVSTATVYRYTFDASPFRPWAEANGQWVSAETVEPLSVEPVTDLVGRHATAGIELRAVDTLWPLHDQVVASPWDFSMVRMANAAPQS
jgi:hypothetical protein